MIARELENRKGTILCSVDSWKKRTAAAKEYLSASCDNINCQIAITEMELRLLNGRILPDYDISGLKIQEKSPFDIVPIDVPPLNRIICEAAVYKAMRLLKKGGMAVIADASLIEPKERKWKQMLGDNGIFYSLDGIGNGIAVIEKIKDGKPKWLGLSDNIKESWHTISELRKISKKMHRKAK